MDWKKINRYITEESSKAEKAEIETLMRTDKKFAKLVQQMQQIISIEQPSLNIKNSDEMWAKIQPNLSKQQSKIFDINNHKSYKEYRQKDTPKSFGKELMKYAGALLIILGLSYFLTQQYLTQTKVNQKYRTVTASYGERIKIQLKDGTIVNLDAGSELRYPKKFDSSRNVYLKGEGYFQVKHNPKKPFQIYVENALVKVLGTKFNIRAWSESDGVTVTVKDGEVALSKNELEDVNKVVLTKNKQCTLLKNGSLSKISKVNTDDYLNWMNDEIRLKNANLKEVLTQLERWYEVKFVVEDQFLYQNRLTVNIKKTNLDDIIEIITSITNTEVERNGKEIKLSRK